MKRSTDLLAVLVIVVISMGIAGSAQAGLLVSEPFDYSEYYLDGVGGGTGWGTNLWVGSTGGGLRLSQDDASLACPTGASLNVSGSRVNCIVNSVISTRIFENPIDLGNIYYISFLARKSAGGTSNFRVEAQNASSQVRVGMRVYADGSVQALRGSETSGTTSSAGLFAEDTTYLVVIKTTSSAVSVKLYKEGDTVPTDDSGIIWDVVTTSATGVSQDRLKIAVSSKIVQLDEIRLGDSFASVVIDPTVDINHDGIVNFIDFALFNRSWLSGSADDNYNFAVDFDESGQIDHNDLLILANNWLRDERDFYTIEQPITTEAKSWTYSVENAGDYQIGLAWIEVTEGNDVAVEIFHNSMRVKALYAPVGEVSRFETRLENLAAGDEIIVKISPDGSSYRAGYKIAFGTPTFDGLPTFDVNDYGAVGDGNTDDFAAIQSAVSAAIAAGGGIVRFDGTKTYRAVNLTDIDIEEPLFDLVDTNSIKIEGNGARLRLQSPDHMAHVYGSKNIQIDGFTVDYFPLVYYQGTITDINVANLTIDIDVPTRYPVPDVGTYNSYKFGRSFIPDSPGARSGEGDNIYIESTSIIGGNPRKIRIQVAEIGNGADMVPRVQRAFDEGATEFVVPHILYGHEGWFTVRVIGSSRIKLSNILFHCVPQNLIEPTANVGPVSFSNVDFLMADPNTELYHSWRGAYSYSFDNRWGFLIEDGDWDGSAQYDDLLAFVSRRQDIMGVSGQTLNLELGEYAGRYKVGDWVSVWTYGQIQLLGMSRITSATTEFGDGTFDVTLESVPFGTDINDVVINEMTYNRDTVVRNCTSTDIGTGSATTRLRTGGHFLNCHFEDVHLSTEFAEIFHPVRARNFVLENCYVRGDHNHRIQFNAAINPKIIGCTLDNTYILVDKGTESAYLNGNSWINMTGDIVDLNNDSDAWLFGDSSYNGSYSGLSGYVSVDDTSTINYSTPPDYPAAVPPSNGEDTTAPAASTGLAATAGDNMVSLDWNDNTEPDFYTYNVYRATTTVGPYSQIASGIIVSKYVDFTAAGGTTYYYVVTAFDNSGNESPFSNETSASP